MTFDPTVGRIPLVADEAVSGIRGGASRVRRFPTRAALLAAALGAGACVVAAAAPAGSAPTVIPVYGTSELQGIACMSSTYCIAVGGNDYVLIDNGTDGGPNQLPGLSSLVPPLGASETTMNEVTVPNVGRWSVSHSPATPVEVVRGTCSAAALHIVSCVQRQLTQFRGTSWATKPDCAVSKRSAGMFMRILLHSGERKRARCWTGWPSRSRLSITENRGNDSARYESPGYGATAGPKEDNPNARTSRFR